MSRKLELAKAALVACVSCLADPSTTDPISLAPTGMSLPADGASTLALTVTADADQAVILSTSTGRFLNSSTPDGGNPTSASVMTGRGATTVTYVAGVTPGTAVITAAAGPYVATLTITLTESAPASIVLTPDRTTVPGDGVSFIELQTNVFAANAASQVSAGTTIEYGVCCGTTSPADCAPGSTPLTIPTLQQVTAGQEVTVRAIAQQVAASQDAVILARLQGAAFTESLCAAPQPGEVRSNAIAVAVTATMP